MRYLFAHLTNVAELSTRPRYVRFLGFASCDFSFKRTPFELEFEEIGTNNSITGQYEGLWVSKNVGETRMFVLAVL